MLLLVLKGDLNDFTHFHHYFFFFDISSSWLFVNERCLKLTEKMGSCTTNEVLGLDSSVVVFCFPCYLQTVCSWHLWMPLSKRIQLFVVLISSAACSKQLCYLCCSSLAFSLGTIRRGDDESRRCPIFPGKKELHDVATYFFFSSHHLTSRKG